MFSARVKSRIRLGRWALCALLAAAGCTAVEPGLCGYVPRNADTTQAATIKGAMATYIDSVDGGDVDSAVNTTANWGSNQIQVLPGMHTFEVSIHHETQT